MPSDFALKQLQKYGWKQGQGLGLNNDGITKPISVVLKQDTIGLGKVTDDYNDTWWDHVFNKAVSGITVDNSNDAVLTTNHDLKNDKRNYSIKVTDEELFNICEKRTARKGAVPKTMENADDVECLPNSKNIVEKVKKIKKDKKSKKSRKLQNDDDNIPKRHKKSKH